jgi:hypothetical protein
MSLTFKEAREMMAVTLQGDAGDVSELVEISGPLPYKLKHTWRTADLEIMSQPPNVLEADAGQLRLRVVDTPGPRNPTPNKDAIYMIATLGAKGGSSENPVTPVADDITPVPKAKGKRQ